jgi:CMD domain protein
MNDDVLDAISGVAPGSDLYDLRGERDEIVRRSESSYRANLLPADPGSLPPAIRAALACRMARLLGDAAAAEHYASLLARASPVPETAALADPDHHPEDRRLAAIAHRVDLLTLTPEAATRDDVDELRAAGLDERAVVTLTGLVAFVNYQLRVAAGLRMLRGA